MPDTLAPDRILNPADRTSVGSELFFPTRVRFGHGVLGELGREVMRLGCDRALIVTTRNMRERPVYAAARAALEQAGVETSTYAAVPADPTVADVERALQDTKPGQHHAVVGLGGGSVLDVAKLIAALPANPRPLVDLIERDLVPPVLPLVAVPTTAGSGSEMTHEAVVVEPASQTKFAIKDPLLLPALALIDPTATEECPPAVRSNSGVDAFVHALEAYVGRRANPISDLMSLAACRLIYRALPRFRDRTSSADLEDMSLGSMLAGASFASTGTAAIHALGYPLSAVCGVPHGAANALVMPSVVAASAPATPRYRDLSEALGVPALSTALRAFVAAIGMPTRLRDVGVPRRDIPRFAAIAAADARHLSVHPCSLTEEDIASIYRDAW